MSATTLGDAPARDTTASSRLGRKRGRKDKFMTGLAIACTVIGLLFLVSILFTLFYRGLAGLSVTVFTDITRPPGSNGGLLNAIVGTLIQVGLGTLIGTPIGILVGPYLAE